MCEAGNTLPGYWDDTVYAMARTHLKATLAARLGDPDMKDFDKWWFMRTEGLSKGSKKFLGGREIAKAMNINMEGKNTAVSLYKHSVSMHDHFISFFLRQPPTSRRQAT